MPKIYNEEQLRRVYIAIHDQDQRRSEIGRTLNINTEEIDRMYEAARKRFGSPAARRIYADRESKALKRPSAQYSNRSAYGIASSEYGD